MIQIRTAIYKLLSLTLSLIIICTSISIPTSAYSEADLIVSNTLYYIKNKNSGKYLTVMSNSDSNGANVVQANFNAGKGQQWKVVHLGNGIYKIVSEVGTKTKVLEMHYANNNNETNVDIWGRWKYI